MLMKIENQKILYILWHEDDSYQEAPYVGVSRAPSNDKGPARKSRTVKVVGRGIWR